MPDTSSSATPRTSRRWLRWIAYIVAGAAVLLVVLYFVVTSAGFLRGVILPRVSQSLNAQLTVADASISPFSSVVLRQVKLQTTGPEPFFAADELRLRYRLMSILRGDIQVDEITAVAPVVNLVQNADGTSNLDPLLKSTSAPATPPTTTSPSAPPKLDLRSFAIQNATFRFTQIRKDGTREVAESRNASFIIDRLANGQAGKFTLAADLQIEQPGAPASSLRGRAMGEINFKLGADLMPESLKGSITEEVQAAAGAFKAFDGLRTVMTCDLTATEIKDLSVQMQQAGKALGALKVAGPFDPRKMEGQLSFELAGVDRQALNLFGAPFGIDFGNSRLNARTQLKVANQGTAIGLSGSLSAAQFTVTQGGKTTPSLDLDLGFDADVDTVKQVATVRTLKLNGLQDRRPFAQVALTRPMTLPWGKGVAAGDSELDLVLTGMNLPDWQPFLGDAVRAGKLGAKARVLVQDNAGNIRLTSEARIEGLATKLGDRDFNRGTLDLKLTARLEGQAVCTVDELKFDLRQDAQPALTLDAKAGFNLTNGFFNLRSSMEAVASRLAGTGPSTPIRIGLDATGLAKEPDIEIKTGRLTLKSTSRAPTNALDLACRITIATNETFSGQLALTANTVDVTDLYDALEAWLNAPTAAGSTPTPVPVPPAASGGEPEPLETPLRAFTADVKIARLFLREILITNWTTTAKVDGAKVAIDPFQLAFNGTPVRANANFDLGVKGWTYATSLSTTNLPLEPIADTFLPSWRGQLRGNLTAGLELRGAGITGTSLQKSLAGQGGLTFTNANIQLVSPKWRGVLLPIALALQMPNLFNSPINWMDVRFQAGKGVVDLGQMAMQSPLFEARLKGSMPIAAVLTNSPLNLPLELALSRSLAQSSGNMPPNTPTNVAYVSLPQFATIKGTVGEPKSDVNKLALGGVLLKSGVGIAEKFGVKMDDKTSNALQSITGLLTGGKTAPATSPTAAAPAGGTNRPATNAPPATNQPALFNLLDSLTRPKPRTNAPSAK